MPPTFNYPPTFSAPKCQSKIFISLNLSIFENSHPSPPLREFNFSCNRNPLFRFSENLACFVFLKHSL